MKRAGALSILHLTRDIVYYNKAILWSFSYSVGGKTVSKALKAIRKTKIMRKELHTSEHWKKELCWKIKKRQIENSEIVEISETLFQVFSCRSFRFCHIGKIKKLHSKNLEKNLQDFWNFRVVRVFNLANN